MSVMQIAPDISVAAARRALSDIFRNAGIDSPELDARLLVGHGLGCDHAGLAVQSGRVLAAAETAAIAALATRRLAGEPVARILGHKEFWGLPLRLNAATLVPRPETETVVEAALVALGEATARDRPWHIADLGTGSGALLLALLSELPGAYGIGTDISAAALACASDNAAVLGLAARAAFVACDYGAALQGPFDLVVSNPPYVAHGDIETLPAEVRSFDPHLALDGGADGLAAYRVLAADAQRLLAPTGVLVMELGAGQSGPVSALFAAAGFTIAEPRHDLSGVARALLVKPLP
jgi:release factor glutamine methyltransferase